MHRNHFIQCALIDNLAQFAILLLCRMLAVAVQDTIPSPMKHGGSPGVTLSVQLGMLTCIRDTCVSHMPCPLWLLIVLLPSGCPWLSAMHNPSSVRL